MGFRKTRTNKGIAVIIDKALIKRPRKDPRYALDLTDYLQCRSDVVTQKRDIGKGLRKIDE